MARSILLGLGFDCKDGQRRITLGKNYRLYGGARRTHNMMHEKCIKFNELLEKRRKSLDGITAEEFHDIADKIGLKITASRKRF